LSVAANTEGSVDSRNKTSDSGLKWKPFALQLYRLIVLVAIVLLIRDHRTRLRIEADAPITVPEVRTWFPAARAVELDKEKGGLFVLDDARQPLGYVIRTRPVCDHVVGYAGPTDTMIVFDNAQTVRAVKIRSSPDTITHVGDVVGDPFFLEKWNGKSWNQVAAMTLKKEEIDSVSGATLTSMAIAQSITLRLRATEDAALHPPVRFTPRDLGLMGALLLAVTVAFTSWRGSKWMRRVLQVTAVGYVGLINGDLIAQSLLSGWAASGVAWRLAPGMALLVAAALVVPWTTRRALYCQYICPHGAAQEFLHTIKPRAFSLHLPPSLASGLRWLPFFLLVISIAVTMLLLPLDLAGIEPFDAYLIRSAGKATIAIAIVGLVASLFIPMAYCKFGCPTGALLEFLRSHGRSDHFGKRDIAAAFLVLLTVVLYHGHATISAWIAGLQ